MTTNKKIKSKKETMKSVNRSNSLFLLVFFIVETAIRMMMYIIWATYKTNTVLNIKDMAGEILIVRKSKSKMSIVKKAAGPI